MMPRLRGTEATQQIRALGYRGIIVGVTGSVLQEDVDDFIGHGADFVAPKPLDVELLKTKLRGLMR